MRLLLDTHALLWWLDGDRRLPLKARRSIAAESNTILVSAISVWEITTKSRSSATTKCSTTTTFVDSGSDQRSARVLVLSRPRAVNRAR